MIKLIYQVNELVDEVVSFEYGDVTVGIDKIPSFSYDENTGKYFLVSEEFRFTFYHKKPIDLDEVK